MKEQAKIFIDFPVPVEAEINKWLNENNVNITRVTQTQSSHSSIVCITIFYTKND